MREPSHDNSQAGTFLPIFLTLFFGGGFLVFLMFLSFGLFAYVAVAVAAMSLLGWLHYMTWGKALSREAALENAEHNASRRFETDENPTGDENGVYR